MQERHGPEIPWRPKTPRPPSFPKGERMPSNFAARRERRNRQQQSGAEPHDKPVIFERYPEHLRPGYAHSLSELARLVFSTSSASQAEPGSRRAIVSVLSALISVKPMDARRPRPMANRPELADANAAAPITLSSSSRSPAPNVASVADADHSSRQSSSTRPRAASTAA